MKDPKVSMPLPAWLQEEGPESDVVLATRVYLSRNLSNFLFVPGLSEDGLAEVAEKIEEALNNLGLIDEFVQYEVQKLPDIGIRYFEEEGTLPEESPREQRYVYIQDAGRLLLEVNVGDHLRIECRRGGVRIEEGLNRVQALDVQLETVLDYAFSLEWGYLTTRLEAVGSGLGMNFLLHLPGLVMKGELETVRDSMKEEGYLLRPLFISTSADNGNVALGELFLLEAVSVAGKPEKEICKKLEEKVGSLLHYEREIKQRVIEEMHIELEDRIYRALGVLERAKTLQLEEALEMLSLVRLGGCLGYIEPGLKGMITSLMLESCPAHVRYRLKGKHMGDEETMEEMEALERARYINSILKNK